MAPGRTHAWLKNVVTYWEAWEIGTSGPIDADGGDLKGPQARPAWASDARARSANTSKSCKSLPGSSDDAAFINASRAFCNIAGRRMARSELEIQEFEPLPHPEQRDRQCKRR